MGSQTPIYAIPYPVGTDRVMDGDDAMAAIANATENLIKLPDRVTGYTTTPNTIVATTWANLPTARVSAALTLARPALVAVTFGVWFSISAITANAAMQAAVSITGATTEAPPGLGFGEVAYQSGQASAPTIASSASVTRMVPFNAGTTTVEIQAFKQGTATTVINYPTLTLVPLRYTA